MKTEVVAPKHYSETIPPPYTWSPARGPIPGWYDNLPPGSRFFSGVRWNVGEGRNTLDPQAVEGAVEDMSWRRLWFECLDMLEGQRDSYERLGRVLIGASEDREPADRQAVELIVSEARGRYREAVAPWKILEVLASPHYTLPFRHGWGFNNDQLRQMQSTGHVPDFVRDGHV